MKFEIAGNPDVGDLTVQLDKGESILCESGAMSRMSAHLTMKGRLTGGFFSSVSRKMLGGESLILAEYTAADKPGFVSFAPPQTGAVLHRKINNDAFYLTAGSYLACTPGVKLRTRFGGMKAFFSGEGAFFIECSGAGDLFFCSYGAIIEKNVEGSYTVDTGHVVAWEPSLTYSIGGVGSLKSTLLSGEGLVLKFSGTGKVYLQTRQLSGMASWLAPYCG
jgi:uncharacterized protein (TIGR00266 family)